MEDIRLSKMNYRSCDLTDQVAIVTGSTRGIGQAIAHGLARAGANLVVVGRSLSTAAQTATAINASGGTAIAVSADVTQRAACQSVMDSAVSHYGRLDIMVCNAGINIVKPALSVQKTDFESVLNVDLKAYFTCAQLAAKQMIHQGTNGSVVMISSIASMVGIPKSVAYTAAKGGVNQLVRSLALEWAPHNIRVNAVGPGWMAHTMSESPTDSLSPELRQQLVSTYIPMNRLGQLEEIVGPTIFLSSSLSSYVTGTVLMVDGGESAQ